MYCKQGIIGAQFSHHQRGHALCCNTGQRYKQSPMNVWWEQLKESRDLIKQNQKVKDCVSCYGAEDKGVESFRQIYNRQFKTLHETDLPKHIDLDLSNFCNLKCIMCGPDRSSTWAKEKNMFPASNGVTSIDANELEEICKLSDEVEHITLQGGEPTMVKEYQTYFTYLKDNNIIQNVDLNVVTNLTNLNTKFFSYVPYFKSVNIAVSVDAYGKANDYIRFPSHFEKITSNIKKLNQYDNIQVTVDSAIQLLSMFDIKNFMTWINELQNHFDKSKHIFRQYIQHVWTPECLYMNNAPSTLKKHFVESVAGTKLEYLAKGLKDNNYDQNKTIDFLKQIDNTRNLNVLQYVPDLGIHYSIK